MSSTLSGGVTGSGRWLGAYGEQSTAKQHGDEFSHCTASKGTSYADWNAGYNLTKQVQIS